MESNIVLAWRAELSVARLDVDNLGVGQAGGLGYYPIPAGGEGLIYNFRVCAWGAAPDDKWI